MIHLTQTTRIFLANRPIDFRKQIDGLTAWCKNELQHDPRTGALFVFMNRSRTMVRILHYDGSGYWLATKRLSQGHFSSIRHTEVPLTTIASAQLVALIRSGTCEAYPYPLN